MIVTKGNLIGSINSKQTLTGELNKSVEYLEPVTQEKEVDPTIEIQEVTPDKEYTGLSKVTVNPVTSEIDNNITPENIKEGVSILGVSGNVEELKATEIRITPISEEQTITPEEPYNGFNKVVVGAQSGVNINEYYETSISGTYSYIIQRATKKIPLIDTSGVTNMGYAFANYGALTEIPLIDTSSATSMTYMFENCSNLKTIPLLNCSECVNMSNMFRGCGKLETIPLIDTSSATSMTYMFRDCLALKTIPQIDTSNTTNISNMFYSATNFEELPTLYTPLVTTMNSMFSYNTALKKVGQLNGDKLVNVGNMFSAGKPYFTEFGGIKDLGKAYTTSASANYSAYTLTLSTAPNLTHESLMNVINNLYDIKTKGCKAQKLVLGSTNLAKLTDEEIAIATNKGWTVS